MNVGLLDRLLGGDRTWSGPCTVVVDADAAVGSTGPDSIVGGGVKAYAPRFASGRVEADTCCLLKDQSAVLAVRQNTHKDGTGAEFVRQTLVVIDAAHVVAVEFADTRALKAVGVPVPFIPDDAGYRPGALVG